MYKYRNSKLKRFIILVTTTTMDTPQPQQTIPRRKNKPRNRNRRFRKTLVNLKHGFVPEPYTDYVIDGSEKSIAIRCYALHFNTYGFTDNYGNVLVESEHVTIEGVKNNFNKNSFRMVIPSERITRVSTTYRRHENREDEIVFDRNNDLSAIKRKWLESPWSVQITNNKPPSELLCNEVLSQ